ncbi:CapA family protein, partial [Treponema sp.]|uniref:CapA family protein n=1 Tax=Treponema sp. TaxID=166 RepID=UPI00388FF437
ILKVTENHRVFFKRLIEECKIDIIWANHPHVAKIFEQTESGKFIMYANGNTISAQRTNPQFSAPETPRDFTGEGLIIKLKASKNADGSIILSDIEPHLITTYITPSWQFVVKELNEDFINALDKAEIVNWAKYLTERKKIMERELSGK